MISRLRFELPPGATQVQAQEPLRLVEGGKAVELASIPPTPFQLRFAYLLTTTTGHHLFIRTMPMPALEVIGLAAEGDLVVEASGWRLTRNVSQLGDQRPLPEPVILLEATRLAVGHRLTARFEPAQRSGLGWLYGLLVSFVVAGFVLLQLALWLDQRQLRLRRDTTLNVVNEELAALERAATAGEARGDYLQAQRQRWRSMREA
jgi:hypothetical protein